MTDDDEIPDLGPCCICETTQGVRNIVMLDRRAPVSGHGWGCFVCGMKCDGASAVLCDECLKGYQSDAVKLRFACRGWPAEDGRIPYDELPSEPFVHDKAKHAPEDYLPLSLTPRPGFNPSLINWGAPDERRTDRCSYCGDKFPDEDQDPAFVPLILSTESGWVAKFCDHCQAAWFGMRSVDEPVTPRKDAS